MTGYLTGDESSDCCGWQVAIPAAKRVNVAGGKLHDRGESSVAGGKLHDRRRIE